MLRPTNGFDRLQFAAGWRRMRVSAVGMVDISKNNAPRSPVDQAIKFQRIITLLSVY